MIMIPGPVGNIEVVTTEPAQSKQITAIICHPHPLFGGTMTNKVVTTIARTFHDMGLHTLRFNFRGVGKTEGSHDKGEGETDDVVALAKWAEAQWPGNALWLAGFSFGGFVAANAAVRLPAKQLVTVAPQVSRFQNTNMPSLTMPWLLIQGEADDVVLPAEVYAWVETLDPPPTVIRMPDAGHFFHGKLSELRAALETLVDKSY